MAIDINEPIKPGQDLVINPDGEESRLGTASEFDKEAEKGNLISLPPNDNPYGDPNKPGYKEAREKAQKNES